MRVYLDNCCYNRPYDDQSQLRISLEAQAKLHVQDMIKDGELELAASYMLVYENSRNPFDGRRKTVEQFLSDHTSIYIDDSYREQVGVLAEGIRATGVKPADAIHTACAILSKCDYLLTTDDRLLKYRSEKIRVMDPTEFIRIMEGTDNE